MDLQNAFYIIAIVFMSLMLLIALAIGIALLVIKAKINAIERSISDKIRTVTNLAHIGTDVVVALKKIVTNR